MSEGQPSILDAVVATSEGKGNSNDDGNDSGYGSNNDDGDTSQSTIRILVAAIAIVLIIILLYYVMAPRHGGLGSKLAKHGWILYVRDGCGYCTKQLHELGGHYPKIVRCAPGGKLVKSDVSSPPLTCSQISGFPTWYSTKTKETKTGLQKTSDLEKMLK